MSFPACVQTGLLKPIICALVWDSCTDLLYIAFPYVPLQVLTNNTHFGFSTKVYDIQGNLQDGSQVVVSVIFENKCDSFLKSMEFNVLDSLNSKLERPEGSSPHDGLTVPFQLPPGQ